MDIEKIIQSLSIKEKASLLCGAKSMETKEILEKGIPALRMSDGPCGLRCNTDINEYKDDNFNIGETNKAMAFPSGSTLANSWNKDLFFEVGKAMGKECRYYNIHALLAPAVNIKKNPLCGRNFEYLSEDPIVSGILGREFVKGVQSENVLATPKHFACNSNETNRHIGDSIVDERALREIYLKQFEIIVKEANPGFVMTSYNRINGIHASENPLLHDILKKEWNFKGATMTDWGGIDNRLTALKNGEDLEMPGCLKENIDLIINGYHNHEIDEKIIDESLRRLLNNINKTKDNNRYLKDVFSNNKEVAIKSALESIVLLKNDESILPLNKNKKIAVIGKYFQYPRFQGGGSSMVNPYFYDTAKNAFDENKIDYLYAQGFDDEKDKTSNRLIKEAINVAKEVDTILLFIGQNDYEECESYDRSSMRLPNNQLVLINKLIELGKDIIVILYGGSSVELPFYEKIKGLLYVGLLGGLNGLPTYQTIFGENNPSGRLNETWVIKYDDHPLSKDFIKTPIELYKESVYVGYRYFESANRKVRFPFGYGLSYTSFIYRDMEIKSEKDKVIISVKVKNSGETPGKEVVQLYLNKQSNNIYRPLKELKGFEKIYLEPNEEKTIEIAVSHDYLKVYDVGQKKFVLEDGEYNFIIGKNVHDDILNKSIVLKGEAITKYENSIPYFDYERLDNITKADFEKLINKSIPDYQKPKKPYDHYVALRMYKTLLGKIIVNQIKKSGRKMMKKSRKPRDYISLRQLNMNKVMAYKGVDNNSLRSLIYSSSGYMPFNRALGILDIVNGHIIRGIKKLRK